MIKSENNPHDLALDVEHYIMLLECCDVIYALYKIPPTILALFIYFGHVRTEIIVVLALFIVD